MTVLPTTEEKQGRINSTWLLRLWVQPLFEERRKASLPRHTEEDCFLFYFFWFCTKMYAMGGCLSWLGIPATMQLIAPSERPSLKSDLRRFLPWCYREVAPWWHLLTCSWVALWESSKALGSLRLWWNYLFGCIQREIPLNPVQTR